MPAGMYVCNVFHDMSFAITNWSTTPIFSAGQTEHMQTNTRDLAWSDFSAASIRIGTVTKANLVATHHLSRSNLAEYAAVMDFGGNIGVQEAHALVDSKVFASSAAPLHRQLFPTWSLTLTTLPQLLSCLLEDRLCCNQQNHLQMVIHKRTHVSVIYLWRSCVLLTSKQVEHGLAKELSCINLTLLQLSYTFATTWTHKLSTCMQSKPFAQFLNSKLQMQMIASLAQTLI